MPQERPKKWQKKKKKKKRQKKKKKKKKQAKLNCTVYEHVLSGKTIPNSQGIVIIVKVGMVMSSGGEGEFMMGKEPVGVSGGPALLGFVFLT